MSLFSSVVSRALAFSLFLTVAGATGAQAPAAEKVDLAKGREIAGAVCAACHAADGNSNAVANPKLAAQHPEYLAKQLYNFKVKQGATAAERANAVMAGFAAGLSDADIRNVTAYYASQTLKPSVAKDKDLAELGKKIYRAGIAEKNVPACAGCHGPKGSGMPAQYPRLAGQWAEYTEAQLVAWRQGVRKNNAQMATIAARLSDQEIKAVADYVAGLR
jgi:cbb3-type cytochrome c oxidase subunit III